MGTGELILLINGRYVRGNQTVLALLARLFEQLGHRYSLQGPLFTDRTQVREFGRHTRIATIHSVAPGPADCNQSALCHRSRWGRIRPLQAGRRAAPYLDEVLERGRNLRRVRTAAGLTQTALAKRSGMHRSYVNDLEAGQRNPTAVTLQRLAKVLGVTPVVFFL